jgi:hypothetical protein
VSRYDQASSTSDEIASDISALERRNKVKDALIGVTAKWDGATLVTEDRRFARDASASGIAALDWQQFIDRLRAIAV